MVYGFWVKVTYLGQFYDIFSSGQIFVRRFQLEIDKMNQANLY